MQEQGPSAKSSSGDILLPTHQVSLEHGSLILEIRLLDEARRPVLPISIHIAHVFILSLSYSAGFGQKNWGGKQFHILEPASGLLSF